MLPDSIFLQKSCFLALYRSSSDPFPENGNSLNFLGVSMNKRASVKKICHVCITGNKSRTYQNIDDKFLNRYLFIG